jgi:hypothetical protein
MEAAKQWNELVENVVDTAEDMAKKADRSKAARKLRDTYERVEHAVGDHRSANALWRSFFIAAAGTAAFASLGMLLVGKKHESLFVGQWVPTLLVAALWGQVIKD